MKKLITLLFIAILFGGCEKETSGFKKVYAEIEVKSAGSDDLKFASLTCTSAEPSVNIYLYANGTTSPKNEKSPEYSMPVGSNLTYSYEIKDWADMLKYEAWSDITFKVYVDNKVKISKTFKKGDVNCVGGGNIIL